MVLSLYPFTVQECLELLSLQVYKALKIVLTKIAKSNGNM